MRRRFIPLLAGAALVLAFFAALAIARENWEFLFYMPVLLVAVMAILISTRHVRYPTSLLWVLLGYLTMHLAGGLVVIRGDALYGLLLWDLVGEPYMILKYDQLVHLTGFYVITLGMYYVMRSSSGKRFSGVAVPFFVLAASLGLGAFNEINEFATTVLFSQTGVGGYENTMLDLVADFLGSLLALLHLWLRSVLGWGGDAPS